MAVRKRILSARPLIYVLGPWLTWVIFVLILGVAKSALAGESYDAGSVVVLLHLGIAVLFLLVTLPPRIGAILSMSLVLRTFLVFWDLNMRHYFPLIHSGNDTEGFYASALSVSGDLTLLGESVYGGVYSKLFGLLFYVIGPNRVFAQYTNALFGVTAIAIVYYIISHQFRIQKTTVVRVVAIGAFLPNSLILSAIFLRESIIVLIIVISMAFFSHWILNGNHMSLATAILVAFLGATFHSGVIAVAFGYLIVSMLYQRNPDRLVFSIKSLVYLAIAFPLLLLVLLYDPNLFLGKFDHLESTEDLLGSVNRSDGGSAYLTGMAIESIGELILFGPIRAFYFLASPVPWDWRGIEDVLTAVVDSFFYLAVLFMAIRARKELGDRKVLVVSFLLIIALAAVMFGAGVSNAGTALRHRFKLMPLFLIVLALVRNKNTSRVAGVGTD